MSTINEAFRAKLLADATVAARFGSRIYPLIAPQNASMPYIIYSRSGSPMQVASGTNASRTATINLQIVDDDYDDAWTAADEVSAVLRAWTDAAGTPSVSGCDLQEGSERDDGFELTEDGEAFDWVSVSQDYEVYYS